MCYAAGLIQWHGQYELTEENVVPKNWEKGTIHSDRVTNWLRNVAIVGFVLISLASEIMTGQSYTFYNIVTVLNVRNNLSINQEKM